jgi:hypothetical protein
MAKRLGLSPMHPRSNPPFPNQKIRKKEFVTGSPNTLGVLKFPLDSA